MKLVKYLSPKFIVGTLSSGMLKASAVTEFNDPFEFHWAPKQIEFGDVYQRLKKARKGSSDLKLLADQWEVSQKDARLRIENDINRLSKEALEKIYRGSEEAIDYIPEGTAKMRLVCFVQEDIPIESDILMWSHYTDSHRGVRIQMDIEKPDHADLEPITYQDNRVEIDPLDLAFLGSESRLKLRETPFVKGIGGSDCVLAQGPSMGIA